MLAAATAVPSVAWARERSVRTTTLAAGTRFETTAHLIDSGVEGPTVAVVAGIHGNETAPPNAADALLGETLDRGRLFVVPRANQPALAARSRYSPKSRFGDLNRNFPTDARAEARGVMAPVLWEALVGVAPDFVLDLHEGWGFRASSPSMGSSVVCARDARVEEESLGVAHAVLAAVNETVAEKSKKFQLVQPGPTGSLAHSLATRRATPALVFETTWVQDMSLRVSQQRLMVQTALTALGLRRG